MRNGLFRSTILIFLIAIGLQIGMQNGIQNGFAQDLSFNSPSIDGEKVQLEKQTEPNLTVVCFLGTECPLVKLYASRLNKMSKEFPTTKFIAVCSNSQDSVDDLKGYATSHQLAFPIIKDRNNVIADQFGAQRTPEVFVLDQNLKVHYQGRIDDQYQPGVARSAPTRNDLKLALTQLKNGKPVEVAKTEPMGCLIGRVKKEKNAKNTVTYTNQIARIMQNHCSECHRADEIGPMALEDYDEVIGWAEMILEVVQDNRMPPWHADPAHGEFLNERRMTVAEKQMLKDWVAAGTPKGDEALLPKPRQYVKATQWRLPKKPDVVFDMRSTPFNVPAEGTVEYQYFVVDPKFETDKWITAAEIIPGDRRVLHHSIVFVRPPDGKGFRGIGWLAAFVPGQGTPTFNPKMGRRIPAGSKLVFQQHYTPVGKSATDMTRIGLVFGDESKIEKEVFTLIAMDQEFLIPPGADNHKVSAQFGWLPKNGEILALSPHMHYRGKSFKMTAEIQGKEQTLLNVPKYDFNWQHVYQLKEPIQTSEVKSLQFTAAFDNSSNNPANPDPKQHVSWGDQTWEEMAVAFVAVAQPRNAGQAPVVELTEEEKIELAKKEKALDKKVADFVDKYFQRFDLNKDDVIARSELPRSVRRYGSWQIDQNQDGKITPEEVKQAAEWKFRHR